MTNEEIKKRAEAHWDHYVGPMQEKLLQQMVNTCMEMSRFHYITSHIHGHKHCEEDLEPVPAEKPKKLVRSRG